MLDTQTIDIDQQSRNDTPLMRETFPMRYLATVYHGFFLNLKFYQLINIGPILKQI